jgi:hypothetical protein
MVSSECVDTACSWNFLDWFIGVEKYMHYSVHERSFIHEVVAKFRSAEFRVQVLLLWDDK